MFLADEALALGLVSGIVADREALIARINKEIMMDKEQLTKAHPELLAQIEAEAGQTASVATRETCLTLVKVVAGEAVAVQVEGFMAAGFTVKQVEALGPMLAAMQKASGTAVQTDGQASVSPTATEETGATRAEVLNALRVATPAPLNTSAKVTGVVDDVHAAIERISAVQA